MTDLSNSFVKFHFPTKTSGLDFAWSAHGYVYHTKFDSIEQVPPGSLQRTGDNILALAKGMARGHQLSDVESYRAGNLVFFDFLGAFVVRWPMAVADVINLCSVVFSLYSVFCNAREAEEREGEFVFCVDVGLLIGVCGVV